MNTDLSHLPIITAIALCASPTAYSVERQNADRGVTAVSSPIDQVDSILLAELEKREIRLGEVVVTARESRGVTTSSLINRQAMAHLQPSSFTDLVELLPGFVSKDPDMGRANLINLRQAPNASPDGYNTSSSGTTFIIDGIPINTASELQSTSDATRSVRIATGKGVDMRSLPTDDIESVEIVRGIPSVEYGDLTSGLVKIKRKQGQSPLEARFKADMQSRLFYLGKGFVIPAGDHSGATRTINLSADYLDSRIDPRDNRDNFKRVTFSARSNVRGRAGEMDLTWESSLNYSGTFERDKNDPDLTVNNTVDYYTNDIHSFSWNNSISLSSSGTGFFSSASFVSGARYALEHLKQVKTVASSRIYPLPVSLLPGASYVGFLPMLYTGSLDVYGRPLTLYARLSSIFRFGGELFTGRLKAGMEWNCSKNFGRGQDYDLSRPITPGNTSRPRPFSDIPAINLLSAYAEGNADIPVGDHTLHLQGGVRGSMLPGIDHRYYLSGKIYIDPRVNLKWTFPYLQLDRGPMVLEFGAGAGLHSKMPEATYLYPDRLYTDYVQLNYYHNLEEYRTMNVMTYVDDRTNYAIKAARNLKWEVRGDISWTGNRLSLTYFRERMDDAFRMSPRTIIHTCNRYDASGHNPEADGAPTVDNLPFVTEERIALVSTPSNSSRVDKEGVEFTFSSRRFPALRTRVTVNGAWFRTTLSNSEGQWYKPSITVNGKELQYAGFYDDPDGSVYQSFNTNFTFDTDLPAIRLNISLTVQNMWFTSMRQLWRDGIPVCYIDAEGVIHPWDSDAASDPYLGQLIRTYTSTAFEERRIPVATAFNIKATKKLWDDRIGIALYVNRLISITPDYMQFGVIQRRYTSPYFGMELNLRL